MSFAFRKHNYNLDEFDRCAEHGCVVMQVTADAEPVCLLDWLTEKAAGRRVVDVIQRGAQPADGVLPDWYATAVALDEYDAAALVLEGGFLLPVEQALDVATGDAEAQIDLRLADWWVSDVLYLRGEGREGVAVELLPPAGNPPGMLLRLHLDILLYLLFDDEIRKYEP